MQKETQQKKSVEQTFLDIQKKLTKGNPITLGEMLQRWTKHLESEGHIKLTGTYKP